MVGYSGTPLEQRLGIRAGHRLLIVDDPGTLKLALPYGVKVRRRLGGGPVDLAMAFVTDRATLERRIGPLARAIVANGGVWVAWPKKASRMPTDVTDNVVRDVALPLGLVDVKVAAIDDVWSGLKLVWRLTERPESARPGSAGLESAASGSVAPGGRPGAPTARTTRPGPS